MSAIRALKRKSGPNRFQSQMMLQPINVREGYLDFDLFQIYESELSYCESQKQPVLKLNGVKIIASSAWWDPAFGSNRGDGSVFAVLFWGKDENIYIHFVSYLSNKPVDGFVDNLDVATYQCMQVCKLIKQNYLPSISIETNGIGKFLPAILLKELGFTNINCAVNEVHNQRSKTLRILEALDAPLHAKKLYLNRQTLSTLLPQEVRDWHPDGGENHDDGVDAIAGALLQAPIRIKRHFSTGKRPAWKEVSSSFQITNILD